MTNSKNTCTRIFLFACTCALTLPAFGMGWRDDQRYLSQFPAFDTAKILSQNGPAHAASSIERSAPAPINWHELDQMCSTLRTHRQYVQTTGADGLFEEEDKQIVRALGKKIEKLRKMARKDRLSQEELTHFAAIKAKYEALLPSKWLQIAGPAASAIDAGAPEARLPRIDAAIGPRGHDDSPSSEHEVTPPIAGPAAAPINASEAAVPKALAVVDDCSGSGLELEIAAPIVNAHVVHNLAADIAHPTTWWQSWGRKVTLCALPVVIAIIAAVIGHSRNGSLYRRVPRKQH